MAASTGPVRVVVQYIALRGDLLKDMKWPLGAVIAQACHASTAAVFSFSDDPTVQEYLKNLDRMHKVVVEVSARDLCSAQRVYMCSIEWAVCAALVADCVLGDCREHHSSAN